MTLRLNDRIEWMLPENAGEDSHGNSTFDWDNAAIVEPAFLGGLVTDENLQARDTVTTTRLAILLPGTVGRSDARARWRGQVYEVRGDVIPITDIRSRVHHCEATLKRVTG